MSEETVPEQKELPKINKVTRQPARTTVIQTITHQTPDDDPIEIDCRTVRTCQASEEAYRRTLAIPKCTWTKLDTGWVKKPGTVIIENRKNQQHPQTVYVGFITNVPSEKELKTRTMHDSPLPPQRMEPVAVLRPGTCLVFDPVAMDRIVLYAPEEVAQIKLTVTPQ